MDVISNASNYCPHLLAPKLKNKLGIIYIHGSEGKLINTLGVQKNDQHCIWTPGIQLEHKFPKLGTCLQN